MVRALLPFLFLFSVVLNAQDLCTPTELFEIKATSGMKMRAGPHVNNKVVSYVPSKSYLLVCKKLSDPATFEGISGHWRRVQYMDDYGYMFDGFLKQSPSNLALNDSTWEVFNYEEVMEGVDSLKPALEIPKSDYEKKLDSIISRADSIQKYSSDSVFHFEINERLRNDSIQVFLFHQKKDSVHIADSIAALPPPPKKQYQFAVETYNYCGSLDKLDPSLRWYGVYYDEDDKNFKIRNVEIQVVMSKYSLGSGIEFDIKSESGIPPHFMIGCKDRIDTNQLFNWPRDFFSTHPAQLFPGQQLEIFAHNNKPDTHNFTLSATGNVTDVGICPEMENYKLRLTGEMTDQLYVQDLTPLLDSLGVCGMPKLYWFGDINADEFPDFIMAAIDKEYSTFTLFLSDTQDKAVLVRKAATWTYGKCN